VQGQWPCRFCDKVFETSNSLCQHETRQHGALLPHPCTHCPRGFVAYAALARHSLTAHGVEVRWWLPVVTLVMSSGVPVIFFFAASAGLSV
jgi:hypothetical protein